MGQQDATRPATLVIGIQREPDDLIGIGGSRVFGGADQVRSIVHNRLAIENDRGEFEPELAAEQISVDKRTWRVNADGTMDTTWRLRPNIKWHDGTPFTSEDVVFSLALLKDPEIPLNTRGRPDLMERITGDDPLTFVIHWSQPFAYANRADAVRSLVPKHLLEGLYQEDKSKFVNSPLFTTDFVGLGPYRLERWERGSHMDLIRFDGYYQRTPGLDRIVVRFLGDANTMVANILSGTVDVLLPDGVDVQAALEVRQRWEGTGNSVRFELNGGLAHLEIQHRAGLARPTNGLRNLTVRRALYHALDRKTIVEVMVHDLAPMADSWFPPSHYLRSEVESAISQYPYDRLRAQQLLREAGWNPAADGILVDSATGQRFETELWTAESPVERVLSIMSDAWKAVGVRAATNVIPPTRIGDREYALSYPGGLVQSPPAGVFYEDRIHSKLISGPSNRWSGRNRSAYENPRVDSLLEQLAATIESRRQISLHRELLQEALGDLAIMPLYWEVVPVLAVSGVKGIKGDDTWNISEWRKE